MSKNKIKIYIYNSKKVWATWTAPSSTPLSSDDCSCVDVQCVIGFDCFEHWLMKRGKCNIKNESLVYVCCKYNAMSVVVVTTDM